jgi:hypothetical protein
MTKDEESKDSMSNRSNQIMVSQSSFLGMLTPGGGERESKYKLFKREITKKLDDNENKNVFLNFRDNNSCANKIKRDEMGTFYLKVRSKEHINPNYIKVVLEFPNPEWISGCWPTSHFNFYATIEGQLA